jgi:hypothetical protein
MMRSILASKRCERAAILLVPTSFWPPPTTCSLVIPKRDSNYEAALKIDPSSREATRGLATTKEQLER